MKNSGKIFLLILLISLAAGCTQAEKEEIREEEQEIREFNFGPDPGDAEFEHGRAD